MNMSHQSDSPKQIARFFWFFSGKLRPDVLELLRDGPASTSLKMLSCVTILVFEEGLKGPKGRFDLCHCRLVIRLYISEISGPAMPTGLLAATPNARQPERKTCEVWDSRFPQSQTTVDTKLCMNGQLEKYKMVQVCTGHTTQHPTWRCSFRCMLDQLTNMKRWQKKKHESALPLWQICPFQFAATKLGTSICFNAAVLEPSFHIAS